jgi:hypothetical protein
VFREFQCVLNIDAQIPNRVLDLGMTEKDLPERMRTVFLRAKTDGGHPLIHQPSILPGALMIVRISSAGKHEVLYRAPSPLEPCQQACSGIARDLELHRSAGLLLDHHRPGANVVTGDQRTDLEFDQIAAAQLAVDGRIKQRSVANATRAIQEEPDGPNLPDLERSLRANLPTGIPRRPTSTGGSCCEVPIFILLWPSLANQRTNVASGSVAGAVPPLENGPLPRILAYQRLEGPLANCPVLHADRP